MQNYARLGVFGILALVALRVGVGWHFYMEGAAKVRGGNFSSEGFLTAAKGPLKDNFKSMVWDHDGKFRLDQAKMNGLLGSATESVVDHFGYTDDQQNQLQSLKAVFFGLNENGERWSGKLNEVYAESYDEIYNYWESVDRVSDMRGSATWTEIASLRGQREKIERDRMSGVQGALDSVEAIWQQYEHEINAIATEAQLERSGYFYIERPGEGILTSSLADKFIPYFDLVVGILLILGLFTPIAGWAAAGFLISVVLSQMPGYAGTEPTYFQAVEALACIVLATSGAGKYAGLDFLGWSWAQNAKAFEAAQEAADAEQAIA